MVSSLETLVDAERLLEGELVVGVGVVGWLGWAGGEFSF